MPKLNDKRRRVAIIGAGPSGLAAAKSALEAGLNPVVFERTHSVGGVWSPAEGKAWPTMQANLSRFTCMYSDHEWPEGSPDFPTQKDLYAYLLSYCDHHGLASFIRFGAEATRVRYSRGHWNLEWNENSKPKGGEPYDYVIICTGAFTRPHWPSIPRQEAYDGYLTHSGQYRSSEDFAGKTVVVIGGGFSGFEIAADLTNHAAKVNHVFNRTPWILPRYIASVAGEAALPLDLVLYRRASRFKLAKNAPEEANRQRHNWLAKLCAAQLEVHPGLVVHEDPTAPPYVVISDSYLEEVKKGNVKIFQDEVAGLTSNGVTMRDGLALNADAIILCTGFHTSLPFLDDRTKAEIGYLPQDQLQPLILHNATFHPNVPNMAFAGVYRGPFFGVMELQARWATMVFGGHCALPSKKHMEQGLRNEEAIRHQCPRPQFPHGDYVGFADAIAGEADLLPSLNSTDKLHEMLWQGPIVPAHFRLRGYSSNAVRAEKILREVRCRLGVVEQ